MFSITWGSVSGWWVPVCLILGVLYAWLLYRQPVNLGKNFRLWLAVLRALVVFVIAMLLVSPLVKTIKYDPQKPLVLIAQDNSSSINTFKPAGFNSAQFISDLAKLKQQLGDQYDVQEFNFSKELTNGLSDKFNGKQTDIAGALQQLNNRFVNQNIGALILATDGLYNQGNDPQYEAKNIKTSIYTIALGDTVAKRDLFIGNVNYNKTAFLGNDFEIEVLATAYQSKGENMHITVTEDGKPVFAQTIPIISADFKKTIPIKLTADKKGLRKFNINITPVKNELSTQNNTETIYVDVLDARQKVLLVYGSPHPDITVIKQAIETNKNFEVKTVLLSDIASIKLADYSLIILYQAQAAAYAPLKSFITKSKTPVWYMLGSQTDLQAFNAEQNSIKISAGRSESQEVLALPEAGFSAFTLSDSARKKIAVMPPLLAPFGSYGSAANTAVLLKQKIGAVVTTYPLLAFADDAGRRTAILTGEGLWRWQLTEYQNYGNRNATDELLSQTVQYLTANANRQRFRVYPAHNVFDEGENVILNAELYNDALELINTPDVRIELKNQTGKNYSFLFSRSGQSYQLDAGTLPVGEYSYNAGTQNGAQRFTASGQLTVKPLNLETRQSAANHQLLNTIAKQSGGQMLYPNQLSQLADLIRKNDNIKTVVYEDKHYSDIIDVKWIFVLILLLLSGEWFLRKREGEV
ncbi:VWA domain-containing protein [Mucilaginibacter sp. HC2]|uniref:VWA domain-containing protein n=1 Tax=Mucilaginibacter inviolabilis TaxID=2714892 RepID=UPI00140E13F2|nr:VWA domain-containing protein [Mucilaginibacter inviolabilis]NHA07908.1 VWA domain-containing protein [Mucilaginibacter inviolabilis]